MTHVFCVVWVFNHLVERQSCLVIRVSAELLSVVDDSGALAELAFVVGASRGVEKRVLFKLVLCYSELAFKLTVLSPKLIKLVLLCRKIILCFCKVSQCLIKLILSLCEVGCVGFLCL